MEFTNVVNFANKDLCEAIKAYARESINAKKGMVAFSQHSQDEMKTLINKAFADELQAQAGITMGATKTEIARFSNHPSVKYFSGEIISTLVDAIFPLVMADSNLKYMAEFKQADYGDSINFQIKSNELFVVSKAGRRGRRAELQRSFRTNVTMTGEARQISVYSTLFEILTGQSYIAEDIMRMAYSMETAVYDDAVTAFTTALGALTGNLKVTNFNEASVIKLCERVKALNGGAQPVILGSASALKSVIPTTAGLEYSIDSDYATLGKMNKWNNIPVIALENYIDPNGANYGDLALDDTKLYIVCPTLNKPVVVGMFGGVISDVKDNTANSEVIHTITKAWDTAVVANNACGLVVLQA